jgi:hypothetical protein
LIKTAQPGAGSFVSKDEARFAPPASGFDARIHQERRRNTESGAIPTPGDARRPESDTPLDRAFGFRPHFSSNGREATNEIARRAAAPRAYEDVDFRHTRPKIGIFVRARGC